VLLSRTDVEFMRWNTEGRLVAVDSTRDSSRSVLVAWAAAMCGIHASTRRGNQLTYLFFRPSLEISAKFTVAPTRPSISGISHNSAKIQ